MTHNDTDNDSQSDGHSTPEIESDSSRTSHGFEIKSYNPNEFYVKQTKSKNHKKRNGRKANFNNQKDNGRSSNWTNNNYYNRDKDYGNHWQYSYDYATDLPEGVRGLKNLGNTCYMNAALQALLSISGVKEYFTKVYNALNQCEYNFKQDYKLLYSFSELANEVKTTERGTISPDDFKYFFGLFDRDFNDNAQHDSYEFMMRLLEELENQLESLNTIKVSLVLRLSN